jgi:integrase
LQKNPSKKMKHVVVSPNPTDYFTPEEFEKIVDGTYAYGAWYGGRDFQHRSRRLRILILLMRWSGLSILDAVTLERRRLEGDRLFLYRHKTKVPVYVPLPPALAKELKALPNSNPRYFFWSGNGDPHTAKKGWQRSLRLLLKTVDLRTEDGRPKRCQCSATLSPSNYCWRASRSTKSLYSWGTAVPRSRRNITRHLSKLGSSNSRLVRGWLGGNRWRLRLARKLAGLADREAPFLFLYFYPAALRSRWTRSTIVSGIRRVM